MILRVGGNELANRAGYCCLGLTLSKLTGRCNVAIRPLSNALQACAYSCNLMLRGLERFSREVKDFIEKTKLSSLQQPGH